MELKSYRAQDLFEWVTQSGHDFTLLDVRNEEEFGRFKVEGPHLAKMINIAYFEFIEEEDESVARVQIPKEQSVRIVCAKEGSAKYVGEILVKNGWTDVQYLEKGIKSWGNLLAPKRLTTDNGYQFYQFIRPGKASCSYGLIYGDEMVVFDPSRDAAFYEEFAAANGARIIRTAETHLQADYISGSQQIAADTGAQILGHPDDFKGAAFEYQPVADQQIFSFAKGGPQIKAIHTPGHTPGSTSFLVDDKYLVSGDAVFIKSIGRPDLGGMAEAWSRLLFATIKNKLAALKDDLQILPGHYLDWDEANAEQIFMEPLGSIKNKNADIYGIDSEADFIQFIKANMRKQPDVYAEIRKVNAGILKPDDEEQEVMDLGKNECAASTYGK